MKIVQVCLDTIPIIGDVERMILVNPRKEKNISHK